MPEKVKNLILEGARILPGKFLNFSGKASEYNRAGDRNFCVAIDDPDLVATMIADGWNVKYLRPREDGEEPTPYIRVKVSYSDDEDDWRDPKIMLISGNHRRYLRQDEIKCLDEISIQNADMSIRPYHYNTNGKTGISAYLKSLYVTQRRDVLEEKYAEPYDDEDDDNPFC